MPSPCPVLCGAPTSDTYTVSGTSLARVAVWLQKRRQARQRCGVDGHVDNGQAARCTTYPWGAVGAARGLHTSPASASSGTWRVAAASSQGAQDEAVATLQDLAAGTIGGCSGVVVGQPLDTVKVRLQADPEQYRGALHCTLRTVQREGWLALFKGMSTPLIGNAPLNAIVFAGYGNAMRVMQAAKPVEQDAGNPYGRHFLAGVWTGFLSCVIMVPADLIKSQLQVQTGVGGALRYSGPLDCARQLVRANGLRVGLYRGWWPTVWRDAPSYGIYFSVYELLKDQLRPLQRDGGRDGKTSPWVMLTAGGWAGVLTWASTYPFDTVKSIAQTLPPGASAREASMVHIFRDRLRHGGWRGLLLGLDTALLRAWPVNAVTFLVYEWSLALMRGDS